MRPQLACVQLLAISAVALAAVLAPLSSAAELPPEIAVDRLLVRAERQAQEGEHRAALVTLDEVLALVEEHGLTVPDAFWFRHAQAASAAGEHSRAAESATRYLTAAGRGGEHYLAALELLEKSDREAQVLREREAAEREERERHLQAQRKRRQAEASAEAAYRELVENAAASPGVAGEVFAEALQSGGRGPAMVVVPADAFRMGCLSGDGSCYDEEKPVREVRIGQPFALSVHEVTFADWDACLAAGGCGGHEPDDEGWGRGARPVINVSWDDAGEYVSWLSAQTGAEYRLPSEAEWEYTARAGTVTKYRWGNEIGVNRANCRRCGSRWDGTQTAPVGSFPPNGFGFYNMHGNVWEWVADCWNGNYEEAPSDGSAWLDGRCDWRVLRGGSWDGVPKDLRAANRGWIFTHDRYGGVGFRVARTLTP